jgi:hypothetical protein
MDCPDDPTAGFPLTDEHPLPAVVRALDADDRQPARVSRAPNPNVTPAMTHLEEQVLFRQTVGVSQRHRVVQCVRVDAEVAGLVHAVVGRAAEVGSQDGVGWSSSLALNRYWGWTAGEPISSTQTSPLAKYSSCWTRSWSASDTKWLL